MFRNILKPLVLYFSKIRSAIALRYKCAILNVFGGFMVLYVGTYIAINSNFLNPISIFLKDLRFSDYYFSDIKCNRDNLLVNSPVVLINTDTLQRPAMVRLLQKLQLADPAVIVLDVVFARFDTTATDTLLMQVLASTPNLVMGYSDSCTAYPKGRGSHPFFGNHESGYDNFVGNDYRFSTVRTFYPFMHGSASLSAKAVQLYYERISSTANVCYQTLINEYEDLDGESMLINYTGRGVNFLNYEPQDYFDSTFNLNALRGKILVLGTTTIANQQNQTNISPDLFYTPLNKKLFGRSYPDMHGAEIHANIIQMMIDGSYIWRIPVQIQILFCFVISVLFYCIRKQPKNNKNEFNTVVFVILFNVICFGTLVLFISCLHWIFSIEIVMLLLQGHIKAWKLFVDFGATVFRFTLCIVQFYTTLKHKLFAS